MTKAELLDFFSLSLEYIDQSIAANRRPDGLYHSYNLLTLKGQTGSTCRIFTKCWKARSPS